MTLSPWLLLLGCAGGETSAVAEPEPEPWFDPASVGPHPVGTLELAVESREGVPLAVQVWYPAAEAPASPATYDGFFPSPTAGDSLPAACATPRPVVLFSHGNEGLRWQSFFLTERLASHGFVVVSPDHTYNTWLDADYDRMAEVALRRPWDLADSFDHLLALSATAGDRLAGCADPEAGYAVVGHSFGGYTAFATAGAFIDVAASLEVCATQGGWLCGEVDEYAATYGEDAVLDRSDPRVWASVPMSPAGYEVLVGGLPSIAVPVLVLTGDEDDLTPPRGVREMYRDVSSEKHLGLLAGASHYTFSDACAILPSETFCEGSIDLELAHERIDAVVVGRLRQVLGDAQVRFPPSDPEWSWE